MEIIIGIIVLAAVGYFVFFRKQEETVATPVAEYKVETPVTQPTAVGEPPATVVVVEGAGEVAVVTAPAKKPRATKPKAEQAPKAAKPKAPVKKVTAKKPATKAPAKKPAAIKAKSKKV